MHSMTSIHGQHPPKLNELPSLESLARLSRITGGLMLQNVPNGLSRDLVIERHGVNSLVERHPVELGATGPGHDHHGRSQGGPVIFLAEVNGEFGVHDATQARPQGRGYKKAGG